MNFFGPIWPPGGSCSCPGSAPDWGCVLEITQNVFNVGISLAIVAATLFIIAAGFQYMAAAFSGNNPGSLSAAKTRITNVVIGLIVVLSAWLIVDFVMKVLYDNDSSFGPWNNIWSGSEEKMCIRPDLEDRSLVSGALDIISISINAPGESRMSRIPAGSPASVAGPGSCSWTSVSAAATQAGQPIPEATAKYLACIARPESTCGTRLQNYNWKKGSSAYGHFQILLDSHAGCFSNSTCSKAAGANSTLDCSQAFRGGNPVRGKEALVAQCTRAASNLSCSTLAANCVLRKQGASAWSGNNDSKPAHQACEAYLR